MILSNSNAIEDNSYTINQSLRFRAANSANLSRTYTSNATWTFSAWIKRGALGAISPILGDTIKFNANDTLTAVGLTTTAVFRDPSAWYHIHVSNGGLYVNGVSFGAVTTSALTNVKIGTNGTNYFDGYMAEIKFIDATSSSYANFGAIDSNGIWSPNNISVTYGSTGFYLPFNDATSLTTLGYDRSGNGNNWTTSGISITAGVTYDVMKDSPTNGLSEVGNYCTLNPLTRTGVATDPTLYDGNLDAKNIAGAACIRWGGTIGIQSGKYYFEVTRTDAVGIGNYLAFGIRNSQEAIWTGTYSGNPTNTGTAITEWMLTDRSTACNTSTYTDLSATLGSVGQNDIVRVCIDMDNKKIWFGKNNVFSGDPAAGTGQAFSNLPTEVAPLVYIAGNGSNVTFSANFGQRPFTYTPPTGFKPLHTGNLPSAGTVTTSGSFTGNASADGPFVFLNGTPTAMTINSNSVTFGTHADKLAGGFKVRSSSSSYNTSGSNTYSITTNSGKFKFARAQANP